MINIIVFKEFLVKTFDAGLIFLDEYKDELLFSEINCFDDKPYKLSIAVARDEIKMATISKVPELDFSPYDYFFKTNEEAEKFIVEVLKNGYPERRIS